MPLFLSLSVSPPLSSVVPPCLHALFGTGAEWMALCQPRKTMVFISPLCVVPFPHTPPSSTLQTFFSFPAHHSVALLWIHVLSLMAEW